ncbi:MAG TPA: putative baseplate assembly protein [Candidatus Thermoplasmatota archaeon]|nr:putative baseplate assembly protein [Candidatus Thermoplasmatota archaeon]
MSLGNGGEECGCGGASAPCGCCAPLAPATPEAVTNRPALSRVRYRVGTYASFRASMLAELGAHPAMRGWTARQDGDVGMVVLDMAATVADILTFYQERIANEALLRTAVERDSVLRLAALLDYRPNPGLAATTLLAFTLEKGRQARLPAGLRVQSVPGPGEKPQKFQTDAAILADARLNAPRILLPPVAQGALKKESAHGVLTGAVPKGLGREARLLALCGKAVEEKAATAVEAVEGGTLVTWSPPMQAAGTRMFLWARRYPLFGTGLPTSVPAITVTKSTSDSSKVTAVTAAFIPATYPVKVATHTLKLDAIYDDLKPGAKVLLADPGNVALVTTVVALAKVTGEATLQPPADIPGSATQGAQSTQATGKADLTVTEVTLHDPLPERIADGRTALLYELVDELEFPPAYPRDATITGAPALCIPLERLLPPNVRIPLVAATPQPPAPGQPQPAAPEPTAADLLQPGRRVILDDASGQPVALTIATSTVKRLAGTGEWADHLELTFDESIPRAVDGNTAILLGNVLPASHGETVAGEAVGDGDATQDFLQLALAKAPLTYLPRAGAPHGAASTLLLRVDGLEWTETPTLLDSGPRSRAYALRQDDPGTTALVFGDGESGARTPTGRRNLVATYRVGLGKAGNVRAGALSNALDKPAGLKAVANPTPASGGADPETLASARRNAPNTVRTFGRVVSLRDFEDCAREVAGVTKARASWAWRDGERTVHLVVGGDPDAPVDGEGIRRLRATLDARRDRTRPLRITRYVPVPVRVSALVEPDADADPRQVQAAAWQALVDLLAYGRRGFGQPVHLSDVYAALQGTQGVRAVLVDRLAYAGAAGVAQSLPIGPDELACLAEPRNDAEATTTASLIPPGA